MLTCKLVAWQGDFAGINQLDGVQQLAGVDLCTPAWRGAREAVGCELNPLEDAVVAEPPGPDLAVQKALRDVLELAHAAACRVDLGLKRDATAKGKQAVKRGKMQQLQCFVQLLYA